MVELLPIPYGKQRSRRQARRGALINLSLQILREAAARSAHETVGTIEVRLALHVLRPFMRDQRLLTGFWKAATLEPRHPWTSCHFLPLHCAAPDRTRCFGGGSKPALAFEATHAPLRAKEPRSR
jgi:hypothetical protein